MHDELEVVGSNLQTHGDLEVVGSRLHTHNLSYTVMLISMPYHKLHTKHDECQGRIQGGQLGGA